MQDVLTVITNTGERFRISTDSIRDAEHLAGTNLGVSCVCVTTRDTVCDAVLFVKDDDDCKLLAIGFYDAVGYEVQWILSEDPQALVYTVAVKNAEDDVLDYQVDLSLTEEPTLPVILCDNCERHFTELPIGFTNIFSFNSPGEYCEVVRIERLSAASLEEASLLSGKNLSDREIVDAVKAKYPNVIERIISFMNAAVDKANESIS